MSARRPQHLQPCHPREDDPGHLGPSERDDKPIRAQAAEQEV
jgi:hypothetical protein